MLTVNVCWVEVPQGMVTDDGVMINTAAGAVSTIVIFLITTVLKPPFGAGKAEISSEGWLIPYTKGPNE